MTDPTRGSPPAAPMATPTGPQLAGAIGAALAAPVTRMAQAAGALAVLADPHDPDLARLEAATAQIRQIALCSQQLARLAEGRLRQSHEKLALHEVVQEALRDHRAAFMAQGIEVSPHLRPVDIIVDPGLLVSLVNTALDWAAEQGTHLLVKLVLQTWPQNGLLSVTASRTVQVAGEPGEARDPNTLLWFLLQYTAQAMGVGVFREVNDQGATVQLEFHRTVRNLSGLTTLDVEPAGDHGQARPGERSFGDTVSAAKRLKESSILLVTDDPRLRHEVSRVCLRLNLRLDITPTTRQATRFCELTTPHLIIIDENLHDAEFDQLHADLVRHNVHFPVIQVGPADEGFAVSAWEEGGASRIGRQRIAEQLPAALALELNNLA